LKSRRGSESSGSSRLHIIQEIRRRKYPAVLNLHGGTTSMLLAAASGAKMRLGQGSHRYSWIYTERIPASSLIWQKETLHTVDHQLSVARWLGIPIDMTGAMLHINESARNEIDEQLTREKTSEYLVISPAATLRTKQWNEGNYAALGDLLFSRYGMKVIYTAAPHEISVLQEIQRSAKERHSYKANLGLPQLFALIERCRAFIGNDSGPMHAAAALKKPVVAIWGSSNFNAWHPWETEFEAVRSELPCMPCPGYECKAFETPQCNNIPISRVIDAVDALLQRTK
jgi:ADP-heptose:LPS heptosyltransferase